MAFPATMPADGTYRREDNSEWYVRNQRWHRRREVETAVEGQSNIGNGRTFVGHNGVTIDRPILHRHPRNLIKLEANFAPVDGRRNIGISMQSAGTWVDFSGKGTNFQQDEGISMWGNGGAQNRSWYDLQHFTTAIWLGDAHDRDRLCPPGHATRLSVTLMTAGAGKLMMTWRLGHHAVTSETLTTLGRMIIQRGIDTIEKLALNLDGGNFADGTVTTEWY
jgi:hypothetical protein